MNTFHAIIFFHVISAIALFAAWALEYRQVIIMKQSSGAGTSANTSSKELKKITRYGSISQLCEDLLCSQKPIQMETTLNRFFTERIPDNEARLVERRVTQFIVSHIDEPVSLLVKKSGYSSKHLIHLFRTYTGLTPKAFQQVRQFAVSINEVSLLPNDRLSGAAWSHSYFDDAHFIRQFTRFSGFTPTDYLKTGNTCSRMVLCS